MKHLLRTLARRTVVLTTFGFRKKHRLVRHVMYERVKNLNLSFEGSPKVLSVSESGRMIDALGWGGHERIEATYPDYTLLDLDFPDDIFDAVVADQVLEHVQGDPFRAIEECFRVVKPGGYVVQATCLLNPHHCLPNDYWRVSEYGLRELCKDKGVVVECSGWGNFGALLLIYLGIRGIQIPFAKWHPLHWLGTWNNPTWPITTWIVVRKESEVVL